jgi:hypothetical protein
MTLILADYDLTRPATDTDAEAIGKAHSVYGFVHIKLHPSLDRITVQYDATRMTVKDVEASLIRLGVPVKRVLATAAAPTPA